MLLLPDASIVARGDSAVEGKDDDPRGIAAAVDRAVDAAASARLSGTQAAAPIAKAPEATEASDNLVLDVACGVRRGIESVGGRCVLSQRTLRIEPHAFNVQRHSESIMLTDVTGAVAFSALGILPNGVRLHLKDGSIRELGIGTGERDRFLASVREQLAR